MPTIIIRKASLKSPTKAKAAKTKPAKKAAVTKKPVKKAVKKARK